MTDEEKKAIHDLKILRQGISFLNCIPDVEKDETDIKAIDIVLNLIEKQSKEIEELKEVKWYYEISRVPKDKIKAKIEEYNKMINATYGDLTHYGDCRRDVCIEIKNVLQSLLEEE